MRGRGALRPPFSSAGLRGGWGRRIPLGMRALPTPRGALTPHRPLADLTWLRVGGPADWLFQPADEADLCDFLGALAPDIPVFPMGVGSNLIVRDGGIRAVVIRLGRGFNAISIEDGRVTAGAAALDAHVARRAAEAGLDEGEAMSFLFEHFDSVTDKDNLTHRLRLFNSELDDRKR